MAEMRLQRFLARAGVAARRKSEQLILRGLVAVNGEVVTELGTKVDAERDRVTVDGEAVYPEDHFYVVLNKPKACITALSDPAGRRTVMEYVPGLPASVVPVGRLDFYSEGVLLLTNDGDLAAALTAPKTHVEKTYHVKLRGAVSDADLERLRDGVRIGPRETTAPAQADRLKGKSKHDWLVITLTEGKSRQIHRMLEALGHTVVKLQRVAFGSLTFHGLRVGDARELTQAEVAELREQAGLGKSALAVSRGKWRMRREDTDAARRARDRLRVAPTPNLTPGGSRKATAKLRARHAEAHGEAPRQRSSAPSGPRAASSPGKRGASPGKRGASPGKRGASSPGKRGASPGKRGASPGKRDARPAAGKRRGKPSKGRR